jgi:hypothetical protein
MEYNHLEAGAGYVYDKPMVNVWFTKLKVGGSEPYLCVIAIPQFLLSARVRVFVK